MTPRKPKRLKRPKRLSKAKIDAMAAAFAAKLKKDPVGRIEFEFPESPNSARRRAWIHTLRRAAELVPALVDELFALPHLGDLPPEDAALEGWAKAHGLV